MALTLLQLNRATLARQLLLQRSDSDVAATVRQVAGLQAQEPASPYIALWNRVSGFDPGELDAAFADGRVLKANLMRITLHAVAREDYPAFHEAMTPTLRASRLNDRRFAASGLSIADADGLVPHVTGYASVPRTKDEMEAMLEQHLGAVPDRGVWWALRTFAPLNHAPTGGPWSFGRTPAFLAAPAEMPRPPRDQVLQLLLRRYLAAYGPASVADCGAFLMIARATVREALAAMDDSLQVVEGPDGVELYDAPGAPLPDEATPAPPRLLGMWDGVLLAHNDRSRIIPPEYQPVIIRRNGDVLPTVLVDGLVCGVWRPAGGGIEATVFHRLAEEAWAGLAAEAAGLLELLEERDPGVYGRYGHWWSKLPAAEARVLGS